MGVGAGVLVVSVLVALSVLLVVRALRRSRWSSDSVQLDDESAHGTSRNSSSSSRRRAGSKQLGREGVSPT